MMEAVRSLEHLRAKLPERSEAVAVSGINLLLVIPINGH